MTWAVRLWKLNTNPSFCLHNNMVVLNLWLLLQPSIHSYFEEIVFIITDLSKLTVLPWDLRFRKQSHGLTIRHKPGGRVLPYMGHIGMCRCEGYGFQAVYSRTGYINQSVWVWANWSVGWRFYLDKGNSYSRIRGFGEFTLVSVSYTHLTLPTIYSV